MVGYKGVGRWMVAEKARVPCGETKLHRLASMSSHEIGRRKSFQPQAVLRPV